MELTRDDINHLAQLANLALTDAEKDKYQTQISSVLAYVSKIAEVEHAVAQLSAVTVPGPLREDVAMSPAADTREAIVNNFPEKVGEQLSVPAVFANRQ